MSEENPEQPAQPQQEPSLLPPAPTYQPPDAPSAWTPPPATPPSDSVWNRVAAFLVLIAVVAAAGGAGIGWSLARVEIGRASCRERVGSVVRAWGLRQEEQEQRDV